MAGKHFIEESDLIEDSFRLAVKIYVRGFRPTFLVGLWRGGSAVGIYVQECLQCLNVETNHIAVRTSYSGLPSYDAMVENPSENIRVHGTQYLLESLNTEDRLLIVDDVCGSGFTLKAVQDRLRQRLRRNMPGEVKTATIWNKPNRNKTGCTPDFFLYESDSWLVLPYELSGLTMDEIRSHKPLVASLLEPASDRRCRH
ncbi:MAG: phosphoribosyltransferase family protein [Gammaproteobacteria bacterium]|jgi:hypoxanthine phosphoribosyltransferase|nr:phosphoribosyltransferase family protein [Gammaproteobacteria bacterium]